MRRRRRLRGPRVRGAHAGVRARAVRHEPAPAPQPRTQGHARGGWIHDYTYYIIQYIIHFIYTPLKKT